jgi:hypothetical protein
MAPSLVSQDIRMAVDRVAFARQAFRYLPYGDRPDPWQEDLLRSSSKRIILNCPRQSGKTTVVAALVLHKAIYTPKSFSIIFARTQDQSTEFFKRVAELAYGLGMDAVDPEALRKTGMDLKNGSRIEARPGSERSARSRTADLIVIDEAARVEERLYYGIRPMLAVTGGRLIVLSTPNGKRGFFYEIWTSSASRGAGARWERYQVTAEECPRLTEEFLQEEREELPSWVYRQEYELSFEETEDQVFTTEMVEAAVSSEVQPLFGRGG